MARKTKSSTTTLSAIDVTHALAKAKPATCGDAFGILTGLNAGNAAEFAAEGCKRLPRHHGEHRSAKPRGLMTAAQRKAASAVTKRSAKPKVKPLLKRTFKVGAEVWQVVVMPDGSAVTSKVEAAASPKVTVVPEAEVARRVAASPKRAKVTRPVGDPTANAAVRRASRQPKAAAQVAATA